ncbi:hypothetical protein WMY93_026563 [Mugilogobius chulae]|uniref:Cystein proteinase inhibitor protein salarin n=1 Tax=Mugilogobius chulae TaxID=88201 RepID=A0AAW0N4M6_9GOBI
MQSYRMLLVHLCTLLIICSVLSVPVKNPDLDQQFEEWKKKHEKFYSTPEEEAERRMIWEKSLKFVEAHNKEADQGLHTFWVGMNQFSDQKEEERSKGCYLPPLDFPEVKLPELETVDNSTSLNSTNI